MKITPLNGAAFKGCSDVCKVLLKHGADVNAIGPVSKMTARNIPHASPSLMFSYVSTWVQLYTSQHSKDILMCVKCF